MISILFCRMIMFYNFMIYSATKCYAVCGCGQSTLAATSSIAASMTAAPVNIVLMKLSWPGQSQNETCLINYSVYLHPSLSHLGLSSLSLEYDLKQSGDGHLGHL